MQIHGYASNPQPLYYQTARDTTVLPVFCLLDQRSQIWLYIEANDYRSNFSKTILFENCSCFSKIPLSISVEYPRIFQCLILIPAGHWGPFLRSDTEADFPRPVRSAKRSHFAATVFVRSKPVNWVRILSQMFMFLTDTTKTDFVHILVRTH